jgi:prepilin-type N-terminal cleavage/methylation domain-containing protein
VRRGHLQDDGFTVVEVLLAMVLVLVVATSSAAAVLSTHKQLSLARQRQWAAGVAMAALEQVRALPYPVVAAGLVPADLSGDPFVVPVSGGYNLVVPAAVLGAATAIDEPLVVTGGGSASAPVYPHVSTPSAGSYPTAFATPPSLAVYVTRVGADSGAFTVTALVRWTPPGGGGTRILVERTRLFSPPGSGGA